LRLLFTCCHPALAPEARIASAKVPYRVPEAADLPERLGGVLAVLFLVFNEGYLATGDGDPVRGQLTGEAIRLTRILRQLLPEEPEVAGPLGLLVLTGAGVRPRAQWAAGLAR
jgi:RNA polymerase sigma-70 factor, ECF subfamily